MSGDLKRLLHLDERNSYILEKLAIIGSFAMVGVLTTDEETQNEALDEMIKSARLLGKELPPQELFEFTERMIEGHESL